MSILREEIRMLRAQRRELQRALKQANETIARLQSVPHINPQTGTIRRYTPAAAPGGYVRYEVNMVCNNGLSTEDIGTILAADVGEILD